MYHFWRLLPNVWWLFVRNKSSLKQYNRIFFFWGGERNLKTLERYVTRSWSYTRFTHRSLFLNDLYGPDVKICQFFFVQHGYVEIAVVLAVHLGRRPVLYAHHLKIEKQKKKTPRLPFTDRQLPPSLPGQRHYNRFPYLDEVERLGQHDDATGVFLPYHSPKIVDRVLGGPLGDDVGVRFEQTLKIDVHDVTVGPNNRASPKGVLQFWRRSDRRYYRCFSEIFEFCLFYYFAWNLCFAA